MEIAFLLIWGVIWGSVCAWLAGEKGRGQGSWFVLGFFFALIALIVLAVAPSLNHPSVVYVPAAAPTQGRPSPTAPQPTSGSAAATKKCPDCAELVLAEARICRFCRHEFPSKGPQAPPKVFGRWRMFVARHGLPVGSIVELRREGTILIAVSDSARDKTGYVSRGSVTVRLNLDTLTATSSAGILTLTSDGSSYVVEPLDGQDPGAVAGELTSGLPP